MQLGHTPWDKAHICGYCDVKAMLEVHGGRSANLENWREMDEDSAMFPSSNEGWETTRISGLLEYIGDWTGDKALSRFSM